MVQKLHAELNEIPIEVITRDMYCPSQYRPPREIIFIAVDEDKEAAATWLIKKGAAWDVTSFVSSFFDFLQITILGKTSRGGAVVEKIKGIA